MTRRELMRRVGGGFLGAAGSVGAVTAAERAIPTNPQTTPWSRQEVAHWAVREIIRRKLPAHPQGFDAWSDWKESKLAGLRTRYSIKCSYVVTIGFPMAVCSERLQWIGLSPIGNINFHVWPQVGISEPVVYVNAWDPRGNTVCIAAPEADRVPGSPKLVVLGVPPREAA